MGNNKAHELTYVPLTEDEKQRYNDDGSRDWRWDIEQNSDHVRIGDEYYDINDKRLDDMLSKPKPSAYKITKEQLYRASKLKELEEKLYPLKYKKKEFAKINKEYLKVLDEQLKSIEEQWRKK